MKKCSVYKKLHVVPGCYDDYKQLAHYHYRRPRPGSFKAIFSLKWTNRPRRQAAGVIVYSMPSPRMELRNIATNSYYAGHGKDTKLALINRDIRCISRLIIAPQFRGAGLATRLVRETMPKMNVPIIEAMAVMGLVNPFFERAGMHPFIAKPTVGGVRLIEAFSAVGIENKDLIDADKVQQKLDNLSSEWTEFIERQFKYFLKSHGDRRNDKPGLERTRYILTRLTARGVYYIWFNESQGVGDRG